MLSEKNIVANRDGNVTFRYQNSETRTLSGVDFLRKILPKGFRRARNWGFLHPNSKRVKLVQRIKPVVIPPSKPRPVVRGAWNASRSLMPIRESAM